jgi:fructose transport system substrate-binding protein
MQRNAKVLKSLSTAMLACAAVAVLATSSIGVAAAADRPIIGLITKFKSAFFTKMEEGARAKANELGAELRTFSGKDAADLDSQVQAIESLIAAKAAGILIVPGNTTALVPTVKKARDAGILVITLDTPLNPMNAADGTFATDNYIAGKLIGEWAAKMLGGAAATAKIALIDENENQSTVDVLRDQGFTAGFGIDVMDPKKYGDETDPRIVGRALGYGNEDGGRTAMENLLQKAPGLSVVYTINEGTAAGAYKALQAAGKEKGVLMVSVDGSCPGVKDIAAGALGATSMQFPLLMASKGVEAVVEFAKSGKKPDAEHLTNTGVELITDHPVDGVSSKTSAEGLKLCFG